MHGPDSEVAVLDVCVPPSPAKRAVPALRSPAYKLLLTFLLGVWSEEMLLCLECSPPPLSWNKRAVWKVPSYVQKRLWRGLPDGPLSTAFGLLAVLRVTPLRCFQVMVFSASFISPRGSHTGASHPPLSDKY